MLASIVVIQYTHTQDSCYIRHVKLIKTSTFTVEVFILKCFSKRSKYTKVSLKIMKWLQSFMSNKHQFSILPTKHNHIFSLDIKNDHISANALKVIARLQDRGYQAYLIGGCVRDILLGYSPKDFDVATNATPSEIKKIFSNCRIIGKRFLLAHILFRDEIIEVATFRKSFVKKATQKTQILAQDNTFGTIKDDVYRRDFTLNALYFDPISKEIVDHVHGLRDLEQKALKIIGAPGLRFQEDPVRMIRAARYAAKLSLMIDDEAKEEIYKKGGLILHVPKARLLEEFHKCFFNPEAFPILKLMNHLKLARFLVPREILKPGLIKSIGKACAQCSEENWERNQSFHLLFGAFFFAFEANSPKEKLPKTLSNFLDKFSRLILVPKQFEQNFKKLIHIQATGGKLRGSLKDYQNVLDMLKLLKRRYF